MDNNILDEIQHLNFNNDFTQFTCTTQKTIKLFTTNPYLEYYNQPLNGGIKYMEKLGNTNTLILLGGGDDSKYQGHKLMIWDDYKARSVRELAFKKDIISAKAKDNILLVVFDTEIKMLNIQNLKLLKIIKTCYNPQGVISINKKENDCNLMLAALHENIGYITVYTPAEKQELLIKAHSQQIQQISLNYSGSKLATSSLKGTIIKIFETQQGQLIQELRRGSDQAIINSLNFDQAGRFLVTSSSNGTIHVFCIKLTEQEKQSEEEQSLEDFTQIKNKKSALGFLKKGELSLAQYRIQEKDAIAAFGPEGFTVIALSLSGKYYKLSFDPYKGGDCYQEEDEFILPPPQLDHIDDYY